MVWSPYLLPIAFAFCASSHLFCFHTPWPFRSGKRDQLSYVPSEPLALLPFTCERSPASSHASPAFFDEPSSDFTLPAPLASWREELSPRSLAHFRKETVQFQRHRFHNPSSPRPHSSGRWRSPLRPKDGVRTTAPAGRGEVLLRRQVQRRVLPRVVHGEVGLVLCQEAHHL